MTAAARRDRLVDRIRKLRALAESGNEHEAATAAARAAEMLAEHQISEAELGPVDLAGSIVDDTISDRRGPRPTSWEGILASGIGKGTGTRVFFERRGRAGRATEGVWRAIGTPDAIATARYLLLALRREVNRLAEVARATAFPKRMCSAPGAFGIVPCSYLSSNPLRCAWCSRPRQAHGDARGWKEQWRIGCAARLAVRLERARADSLRRASTTATTDAAKHALVVVAFDMRHAVEAFADRGQYHFEQAAPLELDRENVDALALGAIAGSQIQLSADAGELGAPPAQITDPKQR